MEHKTDVLIIGTGISGLFSALQLAEFASVMLLSKKELYESSTYYAQGGIASVLSKQDSYSSHKEDTFRAGAYLCREEVVDFCVKEGPQRIKDLINLGVHFTKKTEKSSEFSLGREGGHSHRRVLHADDMTGKELESVLIKACQEHPNIRIFEHQMAIDLITVPHENGGCQCIGAYVLDNHTNEIYSIISKTCILASGGAGKVYLYTSNPDISTGDGIAMAYRAGARIANMEFIQFHPTCLYHRDAKSFLIYEALRGEGGILRLANGDRFMERYHELKELAPRDVVARAIDAEMKRTGEDNVFLDMTHLDADFIKNRFPNIYAQCLEYHIDMTKEPIPVVPAAHYTCGGVLIDEYGQTDIANLFAIGEVSSSGLHGANRLASNSLLEGVVFAHRAAQKIKEKLPQLTFPKDAPKWDSGNAVNSDEMIVVSHNWDELRRFMWNYVGIVRSTKRLERANRRLQLLKKEIHEYYWDFKISGDLIELRNLIIIAELVIQAALHRKESRGLHFTVNYPHQDTELKETILVRPNKLNKLYTPNSRPPTPPPPVVSSLPLSMKRFP